MAQKILNTINTRGRGDLLTINGRMATIVQAVAPTFIESAVRGRILRQEEAAKRATTDLDNDYEANSELSTES